MVKIFQMEVLSKMSSWIIIKDLYIEDATEEQGKREKRTVESD